MRKMIFTLLMLFAGISGAFADNTLSVNNALITQGKSGTFSIELDNEDEFTAFQLTLTLPDGISFVKATLGNRFGDHTIGIPQDITKKTLNLTASSNNNQPITGNSGAVMIVTVSADKSLAVGTKLAAKISGIELAKKDNSAVHPDDVDFDIEIIDKIVIDETSTALPVAASGVDVVVKRTLKKDVWNTICLPFKMTKTQLEEALGSDVKVCEFDKYTVDGTSIIVNFTESVFDDAGSPFAANWPYLLKTSGDFTQFEVSNVDISPNEESAVAAYEIVKESSKEVVGTFKGTLKAGAIVPADNLFLNSNDFYASKGKTVIKGFRGYFWLQDFSTAASAPAMVKLVINGTTSVEEINVVYDDGVFYNLSGMKVETPTKKGIYIKNGKTVVVK